MMLSIFLCKDNTIQRKRIETIVDDYLAIKNYINIELALSTADPDVLLSNLEENPNRHALYILDVDLQHEMNGIVLASKIRELDSYGAIIFVTTHAELSHLTFRFKVEAMDYILKDQPEDIEQRVQECIEVAYARFLDGNTPQKKGFQIKIGSRIQFVPFDEIMYFESSPENSRKIILHMKNRWLEFYSSISAVVKISPDFFRCHQSFVVNLKNIKSIDTKKRELQMMNGRTVFIAVRKISALLERMGK